MLSVRRIFKKAGIGQSSKWLAYLV